MRRKFLIFLLGLYFGAFAYAGVVPQHAFAASHLIHRQVVVIMSAKREAQSKRMDDQPAAISDQSEDATGSGGQNSLEFSWPLSLPDLSFLWKQEHSDHKKDPYNRGQ
jgi:hypothetical protein